jgi:hypothetical protein
MQSTLQVKVLIMIEKVQIPLLTMYLFPDSEEKRKSLDDYKLREWIIENNKGQTRSISANFPNWPSAIRKINKIER